MHCAGLDNRWLVTLKSDNATEHLLHNGLNLFNKKIKLRRYDDVLNDEYLEYLQYEQLQQKLYAQRQETDGASALDDDDDPGGCWEHQNSELHQRSGLYVADPNRRPPSTAVNTPEPPRVD